MPTINYSQKYVTFGGEKCRALVVEDNAGGLTLFIIAASDDAVLGAYYHSDAEFAPSGHNSDGDGGGELAAMDWVALLMQGDDPKSEGWEGLDTREAAAEYDLLTDSVECSIVADTEDVTEGDPLGLSFCGGYGARSFLLAVTEDVPEYAEQRLELIGE